MIKVQWITLRQAINNNSLPFTWSQDDNSYTISTFNGPYELQAVIAISTPPSADQLDFENNYKSNGNVNIKTNVVQQLGADSVSICPFGTMFDAPANQTTTYDLAITNTIYLKGGIMYSSPGTVGDTITVQIVDVNNITGAGAGAVLATYVNNWYVIPQDTNAVEDISLSAPMPGGLYIRFIYINTSSNDTKVIVNLLAYQGTL